MLSSIRGLIARGYEPPVQDRPSCVCHLRDQGTTSSGLGSDQVVHTLGHSLSGGIGFILPSTARRLSSEAGLVSLHQLLARATEICTAMPCLSVCVMVAVQWADGEEWLQQCLAEVLHLQPEHGLRIIALEVPGTTKARSLNAAFTLGSALGLAGIGWVDDDIRMECRCLERMVTRFIAKGCRGAVGASKIPSAGSSATSKLLHQLKLITRPATSYPHGCCILVEAGLVAGGIPARFCSSDDGFVCFELLDPSAEDPLHLLELVPDAHCHHLVGGPFRQSLRRIRRILTNHHIFLSSYPPASARYYFREILFYGLWPLAPWDRHAPFPRALARCLLKAVYFGWFLEVGLELAVRGALRRPLRRVAWGGSADCESPEPRLAGRSS